MENYFRRERMMQVVLIAIATLLTFSSSEARKRSPVSEHSEITVGGLTNHTVHLACNLPIAELPNVQWFDEVYNTGDEPLLIFTSVTDSEDGAVQVGAEMVVDLDHENRHNFHIGSDYSLTISHLNIDLGPGKYFCRSTLDDGTVNQLVYQLTVIDLPQCSGHTELKAGDQMALNCQLAYSGPSQPTVEWYRTVTDEHRHHGRHARSEVIASDDEFDIFDTPVAIKIVRNKAHAVDDGSTYQCKVSIGNFKKECDMILNVHYLVQNVKIVPEAAVAFVGDVIKCSAQGNPTPTIDVDPAASGTGPGWRSITVGEEFANKDLSVRCTASNSLNGTSEQVTSSQMFRIYKHTTPSAPVLSTTTTTSTTETHRTHHAHHQHEQEPHHSHPPKKDEENIRKVQVQADARPAQVRNNKNEATVTSGRTGLVTFIAVASLLAVLTAVV